MSGSSSLKKNPISRFEKPLQSQSYTWSANGTVSVDLSFLSPGKQFSYPVITALWIRGNMTVSTGASGGPARLHSLALANILLKTLNGEQVNLRGSSVRVLEHLLQSGSKIDVIVPNIAASQAGVAVEYFWRMPIGEAVLRRNQRTKDFYLPLLSLLDGGELRLTFGAANPISGYVTVTAGTFDVFADVQDLGVPELPPNVVWKDYLMTQVEQYFPVNGRLLVALPYDGEGSEGAKTAWSSQQITSYTLGYNAYPDTVLREKYRAQAPSPRYAVVADATTTNIVEDPMIVGQVVPLFFPNLDGAIVDSPAVDTLHYKTSLGSLPATTPVMIIGSVLSRSIAMMERNIPGIASAAPDKVDVVTADGRNPSLAALGKAPAKDLLTLRLTKPL